MDYFARCIGGSWGVTKTELLGFLVPRSSNPQTDLLSIDLVVVKVNMKVTRKKMQTPHRTACGLVISLFIMSHSVLSHPRSKIVLFQAHSNSIFHCPTRLGISGKDGDMDRKTCVLHAENPGRSVFFHHVHHMFTLPDLHVE